MKVKRAYSLREIRASLPREKNLADSYWTRAVLRPLSVLVSWVLLPLGVTANQATLFSIIVCLAAALLAGAALFNFFSVLDCVDGNIARVRKTQGKYGSWMDGLAGYIAYSCLLLSCGVAAQRQAAAPLPELNLVLLGGIGAVCNLLMRLAAQSYQNVSGEKATDSRSLEKRVSENLGLTGILMPAVLVAAIMEVLPWVVLFYAAFYACACLAVVVRLVLKVQKASSGSSGI